MRVLVVFAVTPVSLIMLRLLLFMYVGCANVVRVIVVDFGC